MDRVRLTKLLYLGAAMCIGSSAAQAQGIRVFVEGSGSFFLDQKNFQSTEVIPLTGLARQVPFRSDYASGGKLTLGGEFTPWSVAGIEAAYGYGSNNLRLTDLSANQTQGYGVKSQRFSTNLLLHAPGKLFGVKPYVTAGLEYDRFSPTTQAKSSALVSFAGQSVTLGASNKIGINYGLGVEWSFFSMLALRLDFRDHLTGTPTYGLTSGQYSVSGAGHDAELSAGLVLHVGK